MAIQNLVPTGGVTDESADLTTIRPLDKLYSENHITHSISMIVAMGENGEIGINGDMIWHLSEDLKRFKRITSGHTVIMGRKTWESLPRKPLPGRRNIIITRNPLYKAEGAEVFNSVEEAIATTKTDGEVFVIGGGEIYRKLFPMTLRLYITHVELSKPEADTFFPKIEADEWIMVSQSERALTSEGVPYRFENYVRSHK